MKSLLYQKITKNGKKYFSKIRDSKSNVDIVYKKEYVTTFKHIEPWVPFHVIIILNK